MALIAYRAFVFSCFSGTSVSVDGFSELCQEKHAQKQHNFKPQETFSCGDASVFLSLENHSSGINVNTSAGFRASRAVMHFF